jgi:hypothetical protein
MIYGTVNADLQPIVRLTVFDAQGGGHSVEAMHYLTSSP